MGERMSRRSISELEDVAARAVPAAETRALGGWLLRATPGLPAKRANSVLAHAGSAARPGLGGRLSAVEAFYAERGLPARFQLSPASTDGIAEALAARGYDSSAPVDVQVALLEVAAGLPVTDGLVVDVCTAAGPEWWRTWCAAAEVSSERVAAVRALFGRIEGATGFVSARDHEGEVTAVGLTVREGEWVGLFNMATLPERRSRGAGRAVLRAAAQWGAALGARRGYLQVETGNDPALALYRRAGFRPAYRYAYLTRSLDEGM